MKVILLCGGLGTRLSEETHLRPKPMVPIGHQPILAHIMESYARHGFNDFVLALGYKAEMVKEYFLNYDALNSDFRISLADGAVELLQRHKRDWRVTCVDTGLHTMTGGRLRRLASHLAGEETFMLTYGDGVCDVDIKRLVEFHRAHGRAATVTAVRPPSRFGEIVMNGDAVSEFKEKPHASDGWINGGYFVFNRKVLEHIAADDTMLEREPLEQLAQAGQLMAFRHEGFWQCMDTLRDKTYLDQLCQRGETPWLGTRR
jgi:glucose-1-phosphate cytidylyltransferase